MYIWQIFNENVENQDLYRKKTSFEKNSKTFFFIQKILYLKSISVKCVSFITKSFQKMCDLLTQGQSD